MLVLGFSENLLENLKSAKEVWFLCGLAIQTRVVVTFSKPAPKSDSLISKQAALSCESLDYQTTESDDLCRIVSQGEN